MSDKITFIDKVKAYEKLFISVGIVIAAIGGIASTLISAQPQDAKLPPAQLEKIDQAFREANSAMALATVNSSRLDERGKEFVPCAIRQLDQVFNELDIEPVCPLKQPN